MYIFFSKYWWFLFICILNDYHFLFSMTKWCTFYFFLGINAITVHYYYNVGMTVALTKEHFLKRQCDKNKHNKSIWWSRVSFLEIFFGLFCQFNSAHTYEFLNVFYFLNLIILFLEHFLESMRSFKEVFLSQMCSHAPASILSSSHHGCWLLSPPSPTFCVLHRPKPPFKRQYDVFQWWRCFHLQSEGRHSGYRGFWCLFCLIQM